MLFFLITSPQRATSSLMKAAVSRRRAAAGLDAQRAELRLHVRHLEDLDEIPGDAVAQRRRHLRRPGHGEPAGGHEIGHAGLGRRRHVGHLRRALLVEHRQHLDLAVAPQRQRRRDIAEEQIDMAAEHVLQHQRLAAIGHVHHLRAGHGHEHVGGEVRRRAVALAAVDHLAGVALDVLDQFLQRIDRQVLLHDDDVRHAAEHGDRHEVLGLVGQLLVEAAG